MDATKYQSPERAKYAGAQPVRFALSGLFASASFLEGCCRWLSHVAPLGLKQGSHRCLRTDRMRAFRLPFTHSVHHGFDSSVSSRVMNSTRAGRAPDPASGPQTAMARRNAGMISPGCVT